MAKDLDPASFLDVIEQRCREDPGRAAYTLLDGDAEAGRLTRGELWQRSRRVAAALQSCCPPGARVALLFPTSLDFVVALAACLAAGLIAVPAPPPDPRRRQRTLPRLLSALRGARPALALGTPQTASALAELRQAAPELAALRCRTLDELIAEPAAADWRRPELDSESVAYLQYTSGSTAHPKGVIVTHGNLLHNSRAIREAWRYDADSTDLTWVPNFHDDGLVHGILQPLFSGARSYLMDPAAFVGRPARWLEAISRYRVTHSGGPDFAYVLAARKVPEERRATLDLSSWKLAYNAAEPVRQKTLQAFVAAFEPCGFDPRALFPSFGLAESTLLVTTSPWHQEPLVLELEAGPLESAGQVRRAAGVGRAFVSCGPPVADTEVVIAEPDTGAPAAPDRVGEIWIRSASVAAGYWRQEGETERTFGGRLRGDPRGSRYLRTGDLGFLHRGELFVTGRHKDLIIVRGRNIYPQDIEETAVASHPALRPGCGAAFGIELEGEERLVVVQEVDERKPWRIEEVADSMQLRLAEEHEVQLAALALIKARTIPKTSSGKIQRHACRAEFLGSGLEMMAAWGHRPAAGDDGPVSPRSAESVAPAGRGAATIAAWLVDWCARELGLDAADVDVDKPFVALGIDSVTGVALADQLGRRLGRKIEPTMVWHHPTIAAVSRHLAAEAETAVAPGAHLDELLEMLERSEELAEE